MKKCPICKRYYEGKGNGSFPVIHGKNCRCCDDCNRKIVIPTRKFMNNKIDTVRIQLSNQNIIGQI